MIPFAYRTKTAPTVEPVSLALATAQAKQTTGVDVDLITQAISAARKVAVTRSGRALGLETLEGSLPCFWGRLWLPYAAPLNALTHIKYYDASNVLTTLPTTVYTLPAFEEPAVVKLAFGQVWPATYQRDDAVQLEWIAGYTGANAAAVQTTIQANHPGLVRAILFLIGHFDENRSALLDGSISKEAEYTVENLIAGDKVILREPTASESD